MGEHRPSKYQKKYSAHWNHWKFLGSAISSETNSESEHEHALLILSKINPFSFLDVLMCFLRHIWELRRIWMGLKGTKKCRLLQSSYNRETFSIFTLSASLIKSWFWANFLKIGNIRVAPPTLAVLPHTWWGPWQYSDVDLDLGQTAKLLFSGHHGYR